MSETIFTGAIVGSVLEVTYNFGGLGLASGSVQFNINALGNLSGPTNAQDADFEISAGESLFANGAPTDGNLSLQSGETALVLDTPITNGAATLQFTMVAGASCTGAGGCGSEADFLDPIRINSASVFDANGNLVSGATLISDSGFNPNGGATIPAPEPSSSLLLAGGLLAMIGAGKARFSRRA